MATTKIDKEIAKMSLDELVALRDEINRKIKEAQRKKRKDLRNQFKAMAAEMGLSLADVIGSKPSKNKPSGGKKRFYPIKYRNPDNENETWTGLGLPPRWLRAKLEQGAKKEDFAVRP